MKLLILLFIVSFSASATELIVKKRLPLTRRELSQAQASIEVYSSPQVKASFDDSYGARIQAFKEYRLRSRFPNGNGRSLNSEGVPVIIPLVWGTFD